MSVSLMKVKRVRLADFSPKMQQKRLAAGLLPDQLGELRALPRPPSWILPSKLQCTQSKTRTGLITGSKVQCTKMTQSQC